MFRVARFAVLALLCFCLPLALTADDTKKKVDGIHGKVKAVDVEEGTLSITTDQGKVRSFKVNDDTEMTGPRGGVVQQRLKDKRFHPGLEITVVPATDGRTATALHLGYDRKAPTSKASNRRRVKQDTEDKATASAGKEVKGKIFQVDLARKKLVVTIDNGKSFDGRPMFATMVFTITGDTKFLDANGAESNKGIRDDRIKRGAEITMLVAKDNTTALEVRLPERKSKQ